MSRMHKKALIHAGFSLVEIMVAMVVGFLTVLAITQTYAQFEGQKRTTSEGGAAQENGLIALHTLETDIRMAGYGLASRTMNNCPSGATDCMQLACASVNTYFNGAALTGTPIMPVSITSGAGSDTISVMYSDAAAGSLPARIVAPAPDSSSAISVNYAFGDGNAVRASDFILVGTPGSALPCARLQVTGLATAGSVVTILHDPTGSLYNPPAGTNIFPAGGYDISPDSIALNMGNLISNQYQVLPACSALAVTDLVRQAGVPGCTSRSIFVNASAVASDIVMLKAQYGIAPAGSQSINCWVNATAGNPCDAGDWAAPSLADTQRIKAVRIAVVARSGLRERNIVTPACTNASGVNNGPCAWTDTAANPAPLINLSADPNWQFYRYKVYQTIVPLRNVIWANL